MNADTDPAADLTRARILLAGPVAELFFSGAPALGAGVDEIAMAQGIVITAAHKLHVSPQDLLLYTVGLTLKNLVDNRPTLEALAAALMRRQKVKQFELARLLREFREATP